MEQYFVDWANSFYEGDIGTKICIIIGGCLILGTIIGGIKFAIKGFLNIKKKIVDHIEQRYQERQEQLAYAKKIATMDQTLIDIQQNVVEIINIQNEHYKHSEESFKNLWNTINERYDELNKVDRDTYNKIDKVIVNVSSLNSKTNLLVESDKESIKSYITDKYYESMEKGYIDLHSLQNLELRYTKYLQENGDSYVQKMMNKLRELPNKKPNS